MSKVLFDDDFFIPVPADIFNDFENGRMDLPMWGVYGVLLRQVDFETGVWRGTAYKISAAWNEQLELRTVQRTLARLEQGYIKIFRNPRGQRGGYHILVHDYRIRFGPMAGHYLDALASSDPKNPVYRRGTVSTTESDRDMTETRPRHDPVTTASGVTHLPDCSIPNQTRHTSQNGVPTTDCDQLSNLVPSEHPKTRRKEKLSANLEGKIEEEDTYPYWIDDCKRRGVQHPFGDEERLAFSEIAYEPDLTSPLLTYDFVIAVLIVCEEHRGKGVSPGNLCSKVIDYCAHEIKAQVTAGLVARGSYWPPDFQEHRDRLRAEERRLEAIAKRAHG